MTAYYETIQKLKNAGYVFTASTKKCVHSNEEDTEERKVCGCSIEESIPLVTQKELETACGDKVMKVEQQPDMKWEVTSKDGTVVKKEGYGYVIPEQPLAELWINTKQ